MRILSQDGRIDLPYENFSLSITQDNCIVAARDVIARPTEMLIGTVAKYSSFEKSQKAMDMLRKKYSNYQIALNLYYELKLCTKMENEEFYETVSESHYFQFPLDDEIEV